MNHIEHRQEGQVIYRRLGQVPQKLAPAQRPERCTLLRLSPPRSRYQRVAAQPERPDTGLPRRTVLVGDALERLRLLPTASIDCVITSPPYYLLRDYGVVGQLGLENNVEDWVNNLLAVMTEIGRVLKPTGSLWLNLGDSYSRNARYGAPPKSLILAPRRLVLALVEDGWVLRNKVIWAKPNPHPPFGRRPSEHHLRARLPLGPLQSLSLCLDEIREPHRTVRVGSRVRPGKYLGVIEAGPDRLPATTAVSIHAQEEGRSGHPLGRIRATSGWSPPAATAGPTLRPFLSA